MLAGLSRRTSDSWYRIDSEAVGQIIRVAGCHPYFTQLVCRTLLDVLSNEKRLRVMTLSHVLDAIDRSLLSGDEQIGYPWTEDDCGTDERLVLSVLAHEGVDGNPVSPTTVRSELDSMVSQQLSGTAINRLETRGVLTRDDRGRLTFKVPLFQKWLVRKSFDNLELTVQYNEDRESAGSSTFRTENEPVHQSPVNDHTRILPQAEEDAVPKLTAFLGHLCRVQPPPDSLSLIGDRRSG